MRIRITPAKDDGSHVFHGTSSTSHAKATPSSSEKDSAILSEAASATFGLNCKLGLMASANQVVGIEDTLELLKAPLEAVKILFFDIVS